MPIVAVFWAFEGDELRQVGLSAEQIRQHPRDQIGLAFWLMSTEMAQECAQQLALERSIVFGDNLLPVAQVMIHKDQLDQRAAQHHESERYGKFGIGVLDFFTMGKKQLHQVAIAAKFQIDHFPVESSIWTCLNELADAAQQAGRGAVADQHAVNQLLGQ